MARSLGHVVWRQWWIVTIIWFACAIVVVVIVKHARHKMMLTVLANLGVAWPVVAPQALFTGSRRLRNHWRRVLLIAVLAGLERNLTNSSLYSIGGSLKTALHSNNVLLTFIFAALLGADDMARGCFLRCMCRENTLMAVGILFVAMGGIVTAIYGAEQSEDRSAAWGGSAVGVTLQLLSSFVYALKFVAAKLLLMDGDCQPNNARIYFESSMVPPSKMQIAFVASPVTGLIALAFVPFFEENMACPSASAFVPVGVGAVGILISELRLTELTSPLTVAVLGVIHNVIIVLFFVLWDGEELSDPQSWGFMVSTAGSLMYACSRWIHRPRERETVGSDIGSHVEELMPVS